MSKKLRISGLCLILAVLYPFFSGKYVIALDMPWGPIMNNASDTSNYYLLKEALTVSSTILSSSVSQTIVFSLILISILMGSKLLFSFARSPNIHLIAGPLIYLFNPFFYTRLVMGQYLVLLGYALLPWAVAALYKFLQTPGWPKAWRLALWAAAIGLTSIHTIGFLALIALVMVAVHGKAESKAKLKWGSVALLIAALLNINWLLPAITGSSSTTQNIASFTPSQLEAFATQPNVAGSVPLSAALLTGFWSDSLDRYVLPSATPIFYIGAAIIAVLVGFGLWRVFKQKDKLGMSLAISGFIAWLLGMGIAWGGSAWLTRLLIDIVPFYSGYREPQKWLMVLALAYAYLAAVGLAYLVQRYAPYKRAIITAAFIAPFLFAPSLLWGAGGQLKAVQYPAGWASANQTLQAQGATEDTKVLVLPWHMYLPLGFVGRTVANPAPNYFPYDMITGNNPEIRGVGNSDETPLTLYVNNRLVPLTSEHKANVGERLKGYDVEYVMLLKEADWRSYGWLDGAQGLRAVGNNDSIKIYRVVKP